jgi:hypothetical protein
MSSPYSFRRFKPYSNPEMQHLSTRLCFLLVALSSVLLRSQTLLSSARNINFAPAEPNQAADTIPFDVQVSIFIIASCLILPFVWLVKPFDWIFTSLSLVRRRYLSPAFQKSAQLHENAFGHNSSSEQTQIDPAEGIEMTGLICRDESSAFDRPTGDAIDECCDLDMDLFTTLRRDAALAGGQPALLDDSGHIQRRYV